MAAFRMALWAALILLDRQWLTDDDSTIKGESLDSSTAAQHCGYKPQCPLSANARISIVCQWCAGLVSSATAALPIKRMPYVCMQSCCSFWASMCGGTTRS